MIEHFGFCFQNSVTAAQVFHVCQSDVGDDADIRLADRCEAVHFAEMIDPHFQNGNLVFLADVENGQRESDLIKVTFCF